MSGLKIIIADDHPLYRGALRTTLEDVSPDHNIAEASDLDSLVQHLNTDQEMDLVLLDLTMPGVQGFSGLLFIRAQYPQLPVIIVSGSDDGATIRQCLELGASGFLPKSGPVSDIMTCINAVMDGDIWTPGGPGHTHNLSAAETAFLARLSSLTPQQIRVLMMLSSGLMNKQIAYELSVSEATVKAHVSAILQKLNVDSRTQAVIAAARLETGQWQAMLERK